MPPRILPAEIEEALGRAIRRTTEASVRRVIREEALFAIPHAPVPHDMVSEAIVAAAVLENETPLTKVAGLSPDDFFCHMYRLVFVVAMSFREIGILRPSDDQIKHALERMGYNTSNLEWDMRCLRLEVPAVYRVEKHVERIRALARRRRALAALEEACAHLRQSCRTEDTERPGIPDDTGLLRSLLERARNEIEDT